MKNKNENIFCHDLRDFELNKISKKERKSILKVCNLFLKILKLTKNFKIKNILTNYLSTNVVLYI